MPVRVLLTPPSRLLTQVILHAVLLTFQDVIITEEDCGTLRGLVATAIKNNEDVVESLYERILGRTTVHDIYNPPTGELIISAGDEITEDVTSSIDQSPIEQVEIRSVLTCESKKGVCAKC